MQTLTADEFIGKIKRLKEGTETWGIRKEIDYDYFVILEMNEGEIVKSTSPVIYYMTPQEKEAFEKEIAELFPGVDMYAGEYFRY